MIKVIKGVEFEVLQADDVYEACKLCGARELCMPSRAASYSRDMSYFLACTEISYGYLRPVLPLVEQPKSGAV